MSYTLYEAIVLARDTYKSIGEPSPAVGVRGLLDYAEKVETARTQAPYKISVEEANVEKTEYRGFLIRGPQSSRIVVSEDLNFCWRRFVICKETVHLLVDDVPARFATSAEAQTREALELYWPKDPSVGLTSEVYAAVVAFELLYPWAHRGRVRSRPEPLMQEAEKFKLPERYLDQYFSSSYGKLSETINAGLSVG